MVIEDKSRRWAGLPMLELMSHSPHYRASAGSLMSQACALKLGFGLVAPWSR